MKKQDFNKVIKLLVLDVHQDIVQQNYDKFNIIQKFSDVPAFFYKEFLFISTKTSFFRRVWTIEIVGEISIEVTDMKVNKRITELYESLKFFKAEETRQKNFEIVSKRIEATKLPDNIDYLGMIKEEKV